MNAVSAKKLLLLLAVSVLMTGCGKKQEETHTEKETSAATLGSAEDILLTTEDSVQYQFQYHGETFRARFLDGVWKIYDSYRIGNDQDQIIICQALADEHPVRDKAGTGFRTPEDMAFEWQQHNLAFLLLPEGAPWKENARDVDINPEDQGKDIMQFFLERGF